MVYNNDNNTMVIETFLTQIVFSRISTCEKLKTRRHTSPSPHWPGATPARWRTGPTPLWSCDGWRHGRGVPLTGTASEAFGAAWHAAAGVDRSGRRSASATQFARSGSSGLSSFAPPPLLPRGSVGLLPRAAQQERCRRAAAVATTTAAAASAAALRARRRVNNILWYIANDI